MLSSVDSSRYKQCYIYTILSTADTSRKQCYIYTMLSSVDSSRKNSSALTLLPPVKSNMSANTYLQKIAVDKQCCIYTMLSSVDSNVTTTAFILCYLWWISVEKVVHLHLIFKLHVSSVHKIM